MRADSKLLEKFIQKLDGFSRWDRTRQADYIAYFLTGISKKKSFTGQEIQNCFELIDLKKYVRLPQYLSDSTKGETPKYVKKAEGYRLERGTFDRIKRVVENEPEKVEVSKTLEDLALKIKEPQEEGFLIEALNCFKIQAYRAFIVMIWILATDHLKRYIFKKALGDFNTALLKSPAKRAKKIIKFDDFDDLKDVKFIELSRSAGVISNDVRKILEEKLGIRNSAAHPSGVGITGHKATEFALDLIKNVLLKYEL